MKLSFIPSIFILLGIITVYALIIYSMKKLMEKFKNKNEPLEKYLIQYIGLIIGLIMVSIGTLYLLIVAINNSAIIDVTTGTYYILLLSAMYVGMQGNIITAKKYFDSSLYKIRKNTDSKKIGDEILDGIIVIVLNIVLFIVVVILNGYYLYHLIPIGIFKMNNITTLLFVLDTLAMFAYAGWYMETFLKHRKIKNQEK